MFVMISRVIDNKFYYSLDNIDMLRKITVRIGLGRIDIQKEITVEVLLNSGVMGLVISLEFARRQRFKLKKIERLIYIRNVDGFFNKKGSIEYTRDIRREQRLM